MDLNELIYSWNSKTPPPHIERVTIEDDTLREGLQGPFAPRTTFEQKTETMRLLDAVGVDYAVLGYPAISAEEADQCRRMVQVIDAENLGMRPLFLARTHVKDLEPIVALSRDCKRPVTAEMFAGTSPLRRRIESWSLEDVLTRTKTACEYLAKEGLEYNLSIEDGTRTPPDELRQVIELAIDCGISRIAICDTVGDCLPDGARRLTEFTKEILDARGSKMVLAWHGHNDKGTAVANTIASIEGGADCASGTFLGLGERAGNAALEQVVAYLYQAGSRRFHLQHVPRLVGYVAAITNTPIPPTTPIVGAQAFATSAGVHSAALLKARAFGPEFADYVYSGVPATAFGREQSVLLGPTSGLANARHALELCGRPADEALASKLLAHAKTLTRVMTPDEIRDYLARHAPA